MSACAADGFPRSDVDVYQVRHQRNRVSCLQNDHKQKMKELEEQLSRLHSLAPPVMAPDTSPRASSSSALVGSNVLGGTDSHGAAAGAGAAFALVDEVTPGSPAAEAGLQVGDRIVLFGALQYGRGGLPEIGATVRAREGQAVQVHVHREGSTAPVQLMLIPRRWSGQGLLGCHITAISDR